MLTASAYLLGLAAITVGAALIFFPAGLIVGGVLVSGSAVLYVRGSRDDASEGPPAPPQL